MFFALWPDAAARKRLYHVARQFRAHCGGMPIPADQSHLTLAFLGEVAMERFGALDMLARSVNAQGFTLLLNRCGGWRHQRLVWAAPAEVPAPLGALALTLQQRLVDSGFHVDGRPFLPHVTLLRRADGEPEEDRIDPIYWKAVAFVLVRSQRNHRGAAYEIVGRYALS